MIPVRSIRHRWRHGIRVRVALVSTVLWGATGCATLGRSTFKEPVVTVREVAVTGLGLAGGSLEVVLSVYNPNRYKLDALAMTYQVDVDSVKLGTGALEQRFLVAGNDSSVVRLPVRFTYAGLGQAGIGLLQTGQVRYRVRGDFTVATPIGNFTRPYDRAGRYSSVAGPGR